MIFSFFFSPILYRYELEYDENRLGIIWDISRRFLGIHFDINPVSDSRCSAEVVKDSADVVLQIADNDAHNKCERRNSNDATAPKQEHTNTPTSVTTKPVSNTTTNYSTTSSNKLSKENVNADASNEDVVSSKSTHANDNNKDDTSKEAHLNCEKDELVLDVLNDDLIEKVRAKISCKLLVAAAAAAFKLSFASLQQINERIL